MERVCAPLTLPSRACVQSMATDPMEFTMTSYQGAAVEGRVIVRWVPCPSRCGMASWALVGAPIEPMLTAAGDAWAEFELVGGGDGFVHVDGDGWVYVFISTEVMDKVMDRAACALCTPGNGAAGCSMWWRGRQRLRDAIPHS